MGSLPETDDRDCRGRGGTVESSQRAVVIVLMKGKKVCLSGNGYDRRTCTEGKTTELMVSDH